MEKGQDKKSNYWTKRLEAKRLYSSIGNVSCPAFKNEQVAFNTYGFTHLIRKKGALRLEKDQIRRFRLIKESVEIITNAADFSEHRTSGNAQFWSFTKMSEATLITVVVRKVGIGGRHFFSVMSEKYNKKSPEKEIL